MDSSTASMDDYEVFLSFRGVDTRQGFTDILYEYMTMAEIRVFRDDDELAIGDKIDTILGGLANSKICIPIFSPKFAQSKWCLREVAKMVDLKKTIAPVFYKVSPDDVKLKGGSVYLDDIRKLEEDKQGANHEQEIYKWKDALKEIGSIKGRELGDKSYSKFCKELVDEVLSMLGPRKRLEIDHFIGDANKAAAMKLLDMESSEKVVYVGIHGMGGIGKTTLTKLIYNQFLSNFDYCGFVPDVREFSASNGGVKSLPGYLYDNLQAKSVAPFSQSEQIADRFKNKKILLILDDVDSYKQIMEIARESSWFDLGSRIILTTRDKKVLEDYAEESRSEIRYLEMEELDSVRALELFSRCAFRKDSPPLPYKNLSERVVASAGGLPLAIAVIGKSLRNKTEAIWKEITERLKTNPLREVKDRLLISYNALEEEQKVIFLDIACHFINNDYTETTHIFYMWEACGLCPHLSLEVLQSLSLVKVDEDNTFKMHDVLRDLGRYIVRTKSGRDLTKQSRLWENSEIKKVLKCKKEFENDIEAMEVKSPWNDDPIDELFTSFDKLRYLKMEASAFTGDFSSLLPQLKWLKCNSIIKTTNLVPSNLVILDLSGDCDLNENWVGWSRIQELKKLKVLDLSETPLTRTPVFSENMALERLIIEGCHSLAYIDPSIAKLHNLNYLSFRDCSSADDKTLKNLLKSLGKLQSLQELHLEGTIITSLPESLGYLYALRDLGLENTRITTLPDSIGKLEKLERLDLSYCGFLINLPDLFGKLRSLVRMYIMGTKITRFPDSIGGLEKLEYLDLRGLNIKLLPDSIGNLNSLGYLDISHSAMAALPSTINRLPLLQTFKLECCHQLHELPELPSSLTEMKINSKVLKKISDVSNLENLTSLQLIGGSSILEWDGSFPRNLQSLTIELSISKLPDLSSCSQLRYLKLSCECSLEVLPNMSGLEKLLTLEIDYCKELKKISGIGVLQCLTSLLIKRCPALVCLENLRELKTLKEFNLVNCRKLTEIQGLGELRALTKLRIEDCESLEKFDNLTALKELVVFTLVGCPKLGDSYVGEVTDHGELQLLDLLPRSSDQFENLPGEAEGDMSRQLMGLDLNRYYSPADQSEADDYIHRIKRRRDL